MKKHLLLIGLKFQISTQITKDDSKTIQYLRNEALKAKIEELIATKQVADANELIQSLRLEVSSLRRSLAQIQAAKVKGMYNFTDSQRTIEKEGTTIPSTPVLPTVPLAPVAPLAAEEPLQTDSVLSFQEWKLKNWVNPADKIVISENARQVHENHIIDLLAESATKESLSKLSAELSVVEKVRAGKEPMKAYYEAEINDTRQSMKKIAPHEVTLYSPLKSAVNRSRPTRSVVI